MSGESELIRVLIVDDEDDIRALFEEILRDEPGIDVVGAASNAEEALSSVAEAKPDVVLMDWMMPGAPGSSATQAILSEHPDVRVVAITAGDPLQASKDMMSAGAVGFLEKGCEPGEIVSAIRSAVRW